MSAEDEFWRYLFDRTGLRNVVTVTGPDLSIVTVDGVEETLSAIIGPRLAERLGLDIPVETPSMADTAAAYLRQLGRGDEIEPLYWGIADITKELSPKPGRALNDLAAITDLRYFVNTTPDDLLVQAIRTARGAATHVVISPNQSSEQQVRQASAIDDPAAVVVNLFGQANETAGQFAVHEEDRLEWLHWLLSDRTRIPPQLKDQPVLFIGCEMPDWLGRFFLRMSTNERLFDARKEFFFVGPSASHEESLTQFCQTYFGRAKVRRLEMPADEFVGKLRARWEQRNRPQQVPPPSAPTTTTDQALPGPDSIFLSYMHEDKNAVQTLRDAIKANVLGVDVWMDEQRLKPGVKWDEEIRRAISRDVMLFIAVISANTESTREGYVFDEWATAFERARSIPAGTFIVPVIIDDTGTVTPNNLTKFRADFQKLQCCFAPAGIPEEGLLRALTDEIRAIRRAAQ